MKKLLLLLPLILSTPVLAESDLGEYAQKQYEQHMRNADKFFELEDGEMGCSEMRMASTVMRNYFSQLQEAVPDLDWFEQRQIVKEVIADTCTPYED